MQVVFSRRGRLIGGGLAASPALNQRTNGPELIVCIGETGFEPATARPPAGCATRLRHSPWGLAFCPIAGLGSSLARFDAWAIALGERLFA